MAAILLVLGILAAGAGGIALGFGIRLSGSSTGDLLIGAGVPALMGGLLLVALAEAVNQLTRIAEALRARPTLRAAARAGETDMPAAVAAPAAVTPPTRPPAPKIQPPIKSDRVAREARAAEPAVDVSATAIERLRSSLPRPERKPEVMAAAEDVPLSPSAPPPVIPRSDPMPAEPRPAADTPPPPPAPAPQPVAADAKPPRLDFLFRSRSARAPQPDGLDMVWPKSGQPGESLPKAADAAKPAGNEAASNGQLRIAPEANPMPTAAEARGVAILKSGVVDGMAYTLYTDGSIEAQLPQGTVRFGSITELRAHIDNQS